MALSGQTVEEKRERLVCLFSRDQIQDRAWELARAIRLDYPGRELVVIGVLPRSPSGPAPSSPSGSGGPKRVLRMPASLSRHVRKG